MSIAYITFLDPLFFLLLILLPILLFLLYKKEKKTAIKLSSFGDIQSVFKKHNFLFFLKYIIFASIYIIFVIILANPNLENTIKKEKKNGIDIVLAVDISESMLADDLSPNRLTSAKNVIKNFVNTQKTNRIGLVVFAGQSFTSIPLTFDYDIINETIQNLSTDTINQQRLGGTAIGDAILSAKNLFKKDEPEREQVVILITDGEANVGVNPEIASISARDAGIKIYTIGIGSKDGGYISQTIGSFSRKVKMSPLNDASLKKISSITSGKYFRAIDDTTLKDIFISLEKLDKQDIEIDTKKVYSDLYREFSFFLVVVLLLLFVLVFLLRVD